MRHPAKFNRGERKYQTSTYTDGSKHETSWISRKSLTISDGMQRVRKQLAMLGVLEGDFIINSNLRTRLDGLPRSDQREPEDPGVAVYWQHRGEPMKVMAIDLYDRVADNLGAVAATLEAMRAIERHGGAQILERAFTGFDALPAPKSAWELLGLRPSASKADVQDAYRRLAREAHPDGSGSHERMTELNVARDQCLKQIEGAA